MALPTFYHPSLVRTDEEVQLDSAELHHARQSRRLKPGSRISVLNGLGLIGSGEILSLDRRIFKVKLTDYAVVDAPRDTLNIAVAAPKGDRQRFLVEALTQLGVNCIHAIEYEYSASNSYSKVTSKWPRYAIEAIKQSQNPWLPSIEGPVTLKNWLEDRQPFSDTSKFFADADGSLLKETLTDRSKPRSCNVLIGPEGGFSEAEFKNLQSAGYSPLGLGDNILRTEVAAISVAAQWQAWIS